MKTTLRLIALAALLQGAQLLRLTPGDTQRVRAAYQSYKAAQREWERVKSEIAAKYVPPAWGRAEYSQDLNSIVPSATLSYPSDKDLQIGGVK